MDERGTPLIFYLHPQMTRLDEMLTLLRSHGCDVNARHPQGLTLLDVAIAKGLTEFAEVLRRNGLTTSQ